MLANNHQRLNIWIELGKTFDYAEFRCACKAAGCEPLTALEFAQKAGMLKCAKNMYPGLPVHEAYLKFIRENQPKAESRGLGDTVAKITHDTGLDKLSALYTKITGKPCGCASRQEALNKLFPYKIT